MTLYSKQPDVLREQIATHMREWYEENRESWWARLRETPEPAADAFMLAFVFEVLRVSEEARAQLEKQALPTGGTLSEPARAVPGKPARVGKKR